MWQIKRIHDQIYAINAEHNTLENRFYIYMFSLEELSLWILDQSNDEIICSTKELNKLLEIDEPDVIPEILELFIVSNNDVEWTIGKEETHLTLNLSSNSSGYKFVFRATLQKSDNKKYSEIITLPFMVTIKNFQCLTNQLCKLLRDKDAEIMEYKLNGATVTRKNVETTPFNENVIQEIFTQLLPSSATKTSVELFDTSMISYFDQVQPFTRQKLKERQRVTENPKTSIETLDVPPPTKPTAELKRKPEEIKTQPLKEEPPKIVKPFFKKPVKKLKI